MHTFKKNIEKETIKLNNTLSCFQKFTKQFSSMLTQYFYCIANNNNNHYNLKRKPAMLILEL
ncbi:MAG: hypothetical protein RIR31_1152 [Bacteroidota bacterium]|jgi:hypothetical protein